MAAAGFSVRRGGAALWLGLAGALVYGGAGLIAFVWLPFGLRYPQPDEQYLLPGGPHWLGTDGTGRDLLAILMADSSTGLIIAALATLLALVLGLPLSFAAVLGPRPIGWLAEGFAAVLPALPPLLLALLGVTLWGPNLAVLIGAIGLANAAALSRLLHRAAAPLARAGYVDAARLAGANSATVARRHLLPNLAGPTVAAAARGFAAALLWEATLSFFDLGVPLSQPSLGRLLSEVGPTLGDHPWPFAVAAFYLLLAVLSFRTLAIGLDRSFTSPQEIDLGAA